MFGRLSSLFGKNFTIGYFLPGFIFLVANSALFGVPTWIARSGSIPDWTEADILKGATVATIVAWLGGIVLVAFNRAILRTLEGYGALNPLRLFARWSRFRFRKKLSRLKTLDADYVKYEKTDEKSFSKTKDKRARLIRHLSERYPDHERWVLPTSFGNIVRSFEVYPRVLYGADSVTIWPRLLAVIPEKSRALLDDAKANVDFWINLLVLTICFAGEICIYRQLITNATCVLVCCFAVILLTRSRSNSAAIEWGRIVKSYFDVFLPELYRKLQLRAPASHSKEIEIWSSFSQAAEYRDAGAMPERNYSGFSAPHAAETSDTQAATPEKRERNDDLDNNDDSDEDEDDEDN
jgi:hypothetical protein